uniref:Apoptotic chromatin condensation inducer 1a n=1 Tax=Iconisemion striatum TaxID=60296 RepID=A0A1A7XGE1_9TELE
MRQEEEERKKEKQRREEEEKRKEKQRLEEERLKEKLRQEEERLREKLKQEEERRKEKQRREEEEKLKEKQRQEEKGEEERKRAMEKERAEVQVDLKTLQTQKTVRGGERKEPKTGEESGSDRKEESLISFDSEDCFQQTESSNVDKLTEPLIDVVYDDFSVRKPSLEQNLSAGAGLLTRTICSCPSMMSVGTVRDEEEEEDKEEEEEIVNGGRLQRAMSPLRNFARRSRSSLHRFSIRSRRALQRRSTGTCSTQTGSYFINHEDKDADDLSDSESHQQDEIHEGTSETDSPKPVSEELLDEDEDVVDFGKEPEFVPFPEISTPLLDTSTQRSKAQLNRARNRSLPSRSFRVDLNKRGRLDWVVNTDTTDDLPTEKQSDSDKEQEEEPLQPKTVISPPSSTSKVPMFPGLSPAALLAGIKKRASGEAPAAVQESEKNKETEKKESPMEEEPPAQPVRSPRLPSHMAGAARVLPPMGGTGGSAGSSPAWLAELKSKKRMNQQGGKS